MMFTSFYMFSNSLYSFYTQILFISFSLSLHHHHNIHLVPTSSPLHSISLFSISLSPPSFYPHLPILSFYPSSRVPLPSRFPSTHSHFSLSLLPILTSPFSFYPFSFLPFPSKHSHFSLFLLLFPLSILISPFPF